ncbi:MAG: hypothetical protein ACI8VT_004428 [Saprospiraceae bacterium]
MITGLIGILILSGFNCTTANLSSSEDKSMELIKALEKVNGGWKHLSSKKDVTYTYTYEDKAKGTDISTERYIFDGDISSAAYSQPVLKMELDYEKIDGVYIATTRRGIFPDKDGNYKLGGIYKAENIKFNNGFTLADLQL